MTLSAYYSEALSGLSKMVSNDVFQAAVIAKLKANAALVAWLTARSAGNEIRESRWQGTVFVYPNVRVDVGTQNPLGDGPCYLTNGEATFSCLSFSEGDSSKEADVLAGLVNAALVGKRLSGTGFKSLVIKSDGLTSASRTGERVWRAVGLYRVTINES